MASTVAYATAAEIRAAIGGNLTGHDTMLDAISLACSRMIDGYCGRDYDGFVAEDTASERIYPGSGKRYMWIDEAIEISQVRVKNSITDTDFSITLDEFEYRGFRGDPRTPSTINFNRVPYHGIVLTANARRSFWLEGSFVNRYFYNDIDQNNNDEAFEPTVEITAKWGYAEEVPPSIKQATIMQAERVYKRQQGGMADALLSADFGQSRYLSELDKDVKVFLKYSRLVRPRFGGR